MHSRGRLGWIASLVILSAAAFLSPLRPARADLPNLPLFGPFPIITSFSPTSGLPGTVVTINGTNFTGVIRVDFGGGSAAYTVVSATQIQATVPDDALSGPIVVATSNGGSGSSGANFFVGLGAVITSISPTSGPAGTLVTITGRHLANVYMVAFHGTSAPFTVVNDGEIDATVPLGATSGPVTVSYSVGEATSDQVFTVPGPLITQLSPTAGTVGNPVTITGQNFTGTTSVRFNGTTANFTVMDDTQITTTVPVFATTGFVTVTNPNGTGTSAQTFTILGPNVTQLSPTAGTVGTPVTITGQFFTGTTGVRFNGTAATFTVVNDGQITTTVPAGATTGLVTVTNPSGTGASAQPFTLLVPRITQLNPTAGTVGTAVTITGQYFTGATRVAFNGTTATATVVNDGQITTTVPAGATTGFVTVTTPSGTGASDQAFTLIAPLVTQISPTFGTEGTPVVITGQYLMGATGVTFNGTSASFTIVNDGQISAVVPVGATTGHVAVLSPYGTGTSAQVFAVTPPIDTFEPSRVAASERETTQVVVYGRSFTGATSVQVNGLEATFVAESDTQLRFHIPAGDVHGPIQVTAPSGTTLSAARFRLTQPLVTPANASHAWPHDYATYAAASSVAGTKRNLVSVTDGAGGVFEAWEDVRSGRSDIYAQHITATGALASGWPADGLPVCVSAGDQATPVAVSDDDGGVVIAWQDPRSDAGDVYAQHVLSDGTLEDTWPLNGLAVGVATGLQSAPVITSDGYHGAIIAWQDARTGTADIYAERVSAIATLGHGWTPGGVAICSQAASQTTPAIAADGAGGAIIAWTDLRSGSAIFAQRRRGDGSIAPGWIANGLGVTNLTSNQSVAKVVSDGTGGAFFVWRDARCNVVVFAQHLTATGGVATGWTVSGSAVGVVCTGTAQGIRAIADGFGGLCVAWADVMTGSTNDIFVHRLDAGGQSHAGWPTGGVRLTSDTFDQMAPDLIGDGAGGVYVTWQDKRSGGWDVYAARVLPDGVVHPAWTAAGMRVCTANGDQTLPTLVATPIGAGLVSWLDRRSGTDDKILAQLIDGSGRLGDPSPLITGVTDVPGDQGGQVRVKWNGSYLDSLPTLEIGTYGIWRQVSATAAARAIRAGARVLRSDAEVESAAPGVYREVATATGSTYWEGVGSIPARGQALYSYVAPSLVDSSAVGINRSTYLVDAHAAFFPYFWSAAPDSGYSVDNLRPTVPQGFVAVAAVSGINLHWSRNPDLDLGGYRLYRGASGDFATGSATLVAALSDTAYLDLDGGMTSTYKLVALDVHGNASDPAVGQPQLPVDAPGPSIPAVLSFGPGVPNPVRDRCVFRLGTPVSQAVRVAIYDAGGREVRTLLDGMVPPGVLDVTWDGRDATGHAVASGVYLARMQAGERRMTRRVVRMR